MSYYNRRQEDEIESLTSIFGEDWRVLTVNKMYCMDIHVNEPEGDVKLNDIVTLQVTLVKEYLGKLEEPPEYLISAPWLSADNKDVLCNHLNDAVIDLIGEPIIFKWIEIIKDFILALRKKDNPENGKGAAENDAENPTEEQDYTHYPKNKEKDKSNTELTCPAIYDSEPITDRKSRFIGHLSPIVHPDQVQMVLDKLKSSKKIANAKHNIVAYRCKFGGKIHQDTDDDGEGGASIQMLKLMQLVDAMNVLVVVTRWYGGIHLGNDRFRHINNATKELLNQHGFAKKKESTKGTKKGKSKK